MKPENPFQLSHHDSMYRFNAGRMEKSKDRKDEIKRIIFELFKQHNKPDEKLKGISGRMLAEKMGMTEQKVYRSIQTSFGMGLEETVDYLYMIFQEQQESVKKPTS